VPDVPDELPVLLPLVPLRVLLEPVPVSVLDVPSPELVVPPEVLRPLLSSVRPVGITL
jgi:hypothetical protein